MAKYDSRADTIAHIRKVQELMHEVIVDLTQRAGMHDMSKLMEPEKSGFDKYTPLIKDLVYGSPEYRECIREMLESTLAHHYANNRHHPEYHPGGVHDMTLVDIVEMVCDWKAAASRTKGDVMVNLEANRRRFHLEGTDLYDLIGNELKSRNW